MKDNCTHVGFVYHKLVAEEAVNVVNNLALVLRTEARIDPSLFMDHKVVLAQEAEKKWIPDYREALNRDGTSGDFAHILPHSTLHDIALKVDNRKNKLSNQDLNQYNRVNDSCDETVKDHGKDHGGFHAEKFRSIDGKTRRDFSNRSVGGSAKSIASSLTGGSRTTGTNVSKQVEAAVQAAKIVASQKDMEHSIAMKKLQTDHDQQIEKLRSDMNQQFQNFLHQMNLAQPTEGSQSPQQTVTTHLLPHNPPSSLALALTGQRHIDGPSNRP